MVFIIVFSSILAGIYGYVGWRIIVPAALPDHWNTTLWIVTIFFWLIIPLRFLFWFQKFESAWVDRLAWLGYTGLGIFAILFVLLFTKDILWLLFLIGEKGVSYFLGLTNGASKTPIPVNPERRQFLMNLVNTAILGFTSLYISWGIYTAKSRIRVKNIDITVPDLPEEFDGFTILQICDIHVGPTIKRDFVQRIVDMAKDISPDLIAIVGDLVDGSVPSLENDVEPLSKLTVPYGKFFVTGNHEYYSGVKPWVSHIDKLGFRVLNNEHVIIRKGEKQIVLAGVTDIESIRMDPTNATDPIAAIKGAPAGSFKILLAHQPRSIFKAAEAGFDLQLSGHTHGGQFFPWNFVVSLLQPYLKGLHKYKNSLIYVCTGVGYWGPPIRVGVPPQISKIRLVKRV